MNQGIVLNYNLDDGVIKDVVILGTVSLNFRIYPSDVLQRYKSMFEGARVFAKHVFRNDNFYQYLKDLTRRTNKDYDYIGTICNVRYVNNLGLIADFHFENYIPQIKELFKCNRKIGQRIGFSPTMEVTWHRFGILKQIDEIKHVYSVDLVIDPATNVGIKL